MMSHVVCGVCVCLLLLVKAGQSAPVVQWQNATRVAYSFSIIPNRYAFNIALHVCLSVSRLIVLLGCCYVFTSSVRRRCHELQTSLLESSIIGGLVTPATVTGHTTHTHRRHTGGMHALLVFVCLMLVLLLFVCRRLTKRIMTAARHSPPGRITFSRPLLWHRWSLQLVTTQTQFDALTASAQQYDPTALISGSWAPVYYWQAQTTQPYVRSM